MSILLQSTELTAPQWGLLMTWMIGAMALAWGLGVFRNASLRLGRLADHPRFQPLAIAFLVGFSVFFLTQVGYGTYLAVGRPSPGRPFDISQLSVEDWAIMASVPQLATLLALLLMHRLMRGGGGGLTHLGLRARQIPFGFLASLAAMLVTFPLVFCSSAVIEAIYQRIGYEHPNEHDLLRVLPQADGLTKGIMLLAITVLAPVTEELLFRGHLQTALRRLFAGRPRMLPPPLPIDGAAIVAAPIDPATAAWTAWPAILLTSIVFALIHPLWSAPPIFLLSLALGYAYERTNNLWTPIFMHMIFNATSTAIFWFAQQGFTQSH